jgi:ketosteroid isomerase-like protein
MDRRETPSNPNVETYRRVIEAFNQEGVEGVMRYFSEDAEAYDPDAPNAGVYRGREEVAGFIAQLIEGIAEVEVRNFELLPAGDRVVGLLHSYAEGDGGGPVVEMRDAHTLTFRDGKVVYWRVYLDRDEALADAGLDAGHSGR